MKLKKTIGMVTVIIFLMGLFLTGCSRKENLQSTVLKGYGPSQIKAGQNFNVQPDGVSALWAEGENITPSTIIVINNVKLHGFINNGVITTPVPKELYAKAGEYPIYLLDTKSGAKSNELKFIVK